MVQGPHISSKNVCGRDIKTRTKVNWQDLSFLFLFYMHQEPLPLFIWLEVRNNWRIWADLCPRLFCKCGKIISTGKEKQCTGPEISEEFPLTLIQTWQQRVKQLTYTKNTLCKQPDIVNTLMHRTTNLFNGWVRCLHGKSSHWYSVRGRGLWWKL